VVLTSSIGHLSAGESFEVAVIVQSRSNWGDIVSRLLISQSSYTPTEPS
jgi:hypothetical protein